MESSDRASRPRIHWRNIPYFNKDPSNSEYSDYFKSGCHPSLNEDVVVASIESKLREHLEREGLGCPLKQNVSVKSLLSRICSSQGHIIRGDKASQIKVAVDAIVKMVEDSRKELMGS